MSEGSREMFPRRDRLAGLNWGPRQAEVNVPKRSATEHLPGPALGLCWPSSAKHQDANLLWATKGGWSSTAFKSSYYQTVSLYYTRSVDE
jgi:hypothetical protein